MAVGAQRLWSWLCVRLVVVVLVVNDIGDEGCAALARALEGGAVPELSTLVLYGIYFGVMYWRACGVKGAQRVCSAVRFMDDEAMGAPALVVVVEVEWHVAWSVVGGCAVLAVQ